MANFFLAAILFSLVLSKLTFGAEDTLMHNQTLAVGQILVSENHVFEVGFFHPPNSRNVFMGIWYKATPDVVVWVANRNNPITHSQGVVLMVSENGTLAISSGGIVIWSGNPSGVATRPVVRLLDTGNLVVIDEITGGYLWQSFDYPTDTMLPGMRLVDDVDAGVERNLTSWRQSDDPSPGEFVYKIENRGLPELVIYRGGKMKFFRSGKWNGAYFGGIPAIPNEIFKPKLVFREERMISLLWPYDSSVITRGVVDVSGSSQRYTMNVRKDKWSHVHSYPRDLCDQYNHCGANGICTIEKAQRCTCFRGFSPKFQSDWDLQDWSGGCARATALNCQSGDGFVEVRGVKYPDMVRFWLNTSMSLAECKAECLKNCSCTACANPYITNGGSGCLMWFGDLLDTRGLSEADSLQNIYIRVPVSELDISTNLEVEKHQPINIILISIASGVLVSSFINGGILLLRRQKMQALKRKSEDIELPLMKIATVLEATNNFSTEIGVGGFGPVYMGNLSAGEEIAVKRLSKASAQGLEEFKNEVVLIAKLQHRNLVRLVGCCIEGDERMLIYEYLPNKSLDYFVFDQNRRTLLTWPKRFDIIMGIARGLLYLHHDSRLKIIHRDLKTSNILLDENLNPKISDFGLARIFGEEQSIARTKRVMGTYGYMAPEYAFDGKFSVKSDIFSLGVVLLEIISGRKNRGFEHYNHHHSLLGHAWLLWRENKMLELLDGCLKDTCIESQVKRCIRVGLLCVQKFTEDRPIMASVLFMLGSEGGTLPDPKEPGYFFERSCGPVQSCTSQSFKSENETITITELEAR